MDLIEYISNVFAGIAAASLISLIFFAICLKIRRLFPCKVNCWFCNTWISVGFDERNSFYCSNCLQYNGFDKLGNYNKIIEEQHEVSPKRFNMSNQKERKLSNGLCEICNDFQAMKIKCLAEFEAKNEATYSEELEKYEKELERIYKLCPPCEKHVNEAIKEKHRWLIVNKLLKMKLYNFPIFSQGAFIKPARIYFSENSIVRVLDCCITIIVGLLLLNTCSVIASNITEFRKTLFKQLLPYTYLIEYIINLNIGDINLTWAVYKSCKIASNIMNNTNSYISTAYNLGSVAISIGQSTPIITAPAIAVYSVLDPVYLSIIGLIFQLTKLFLKKNYSTSILLPWLIILATNHPRSDPSVIDTVVQVVMSLSILCLNTNSSTANSPKTDYNNKKHYFKRLTVYKLDEFSDEEDFKQIKPFPEKLTVLSNEDLKPFRQLTMEDIAPGLPKRPPTQFEVMASELKAKQRAAFDKHNSLYQDMSEPTLQTHHQDYFNRNLYSPARTVSPQMSPTRLWMKNKFDEIGYFNITPHVPKIPEEFLVNTDLSNQFSQLNVSKNLNVSLNMAKAVPPVYNYGTTSEFSYPQSTKLYSSCSKSYMSNSSGRSSGFFSDNFSSCNSSISNAPINYPLSLKSISPLF